MTDLGLWNRWISLMWNLTVVILGLPLRQTDSTFLQQRYETVFYYHSFTLIILEFMRLRRNLLQT